MISGTVLANGDAIVSLHVRGPGGATAEIQAVVDTGFNDTLVLSASEIQQLKLAFREEARFTLADGSTLVSRLFTAEVEWHGRWRRILVVEMDGGPLLGMTLLRGSNLSIDVIDGGQVRIRPLNE
jgi:clan AA aspartic protease